MSKILRPLSIACLRPSLGVRFSPYVENYLYKVYAKKLDRANPQSRRHSPIADNFQRRRKRAGVSQVSQNATQKLCRSS